MFTSTARRGGCSQPWCGGTSSCRTAKFDRLRCSCSSLTSKHGGGNVDDHSHVAMVVEHVLRSVCCRNRITE